MTLSPGLRLGPYEILAAIGAGGMGEVYKARDTQLKRDVALKVLPADVATDPERLVRFQREAELLAALNHPNIAQIYGLADIEGIRALVMELVEGATLAERIARGPVPPDEAMPLASQLAEAIEYAHERGIIHRDLKPANIKLTPDGAVKVLDFGLAKALEAEGASATAGGADPRTHSPTITSPVATRAGMILGTAAYMSPEQARGAAVDKRADVWAFGVVLFEMLTGLPCFGGETITDVLAAVVKSDPDWNALPPGTPPRVGELLHRCLAKDRRQRLRDIGDARLDLEAAAGRETVVPGPASERPRPSWRPWVIGGGLLVVVAAAMILAIWRGGEWLRPAASRPVVRFAVSLPAGQHLNDVHLLPTFSISPDGRIIVYSALQGGQARLYLRRVDHFDAAPLQGTEGAAGPFFSPDGRWLGFFAGDKLRRIAVAGGPALDICTAGYPGGASWAEDGRIIFAADFSGLRIVPETGGTSTPLTHPDVGKGEIGHIWPHALPGGRGVLFSILTEETRLVAVLSLDTGRWQTIGKAGGADGYLPTGHLLFQQSGSLMVVPFDLTRLARLGEATSVLQGLPVTEVAGEDQTLIGFSATGTLVHESGSSGGIDLTPVWVDREGVESALPIPAGRYNYPRISPDGTRLAVGAEKAQILIYDLETGRRTRLTQGGINYSPVWAWDGTRIAFTAYGAGYVNIFWKSADGDDRPQPLVVNRDERKYPASWSRDGTLIYNTLNPRTRGDIWTLPIGGAPSPLRTTPFLERLARLSPDGRRLAYVSDESGSDEIYVRPFPEPGDTVAVSAGGGTEPVWSRDGKELFYRSGPAMMAVDVLPGPKFKAGRTRLLFKGAYDAGALIGAMYDVDVPGRRFLMMKPIAAQPPSAELKVVINWFEELKTKVPTR